MIKIKKLIPTLIILAPVIHFGMMKDNKYPCVYKNTVKEDLKVLKD